MSVFSYDGFIDVTLKDRELLSGYLLASEPDTCESNFLSIYAWADVYRTRFQIFSGFAWVYLAKEDELLFPWKSRDTGLWPAPQLLFEVSSALRRNGGSGIVYTVPPAYVEKYPLCMEYFRTEEMPETVDEYIYSVEKLLTLSGSKLGKKKNLISQFSRNFPDWKAVPMTEAELPDCVALSRAWDLRKMNTGPDAFGIADEISAMDRMFADYSRLDLCGCCIYGGGRLLAFSVNSRVNRDTFTEHYEKSDPDVKGAAQIVNRENARMLQGSCMYLNREQDLGIEGLRHAKMSYVPCRKIRNIMLKPLEG